MTDARDDEDLEIFLRQFEPRAPSPLPERRLTPRGPWWALAAAGLVGAVLWIARPASAPVPAAAVAPSPASEVSAPQLPSRPTMAELSVVLRPALPARSLGELESRVLADPRRRGGALRVLAAGEPGMSD